MRLSVHRDVVVLRHPDYLVHWRKKGACTVEGVKDAGTTDFERDGVVVLGPEGGLDDTDRLRQAGVVSAAGLGEDRVAAIIKRADGAAALAQGSLPFDGVWDEVVSLASVEGPRLQWPSGLIWDPSLTLDSLYEDAEKVGGRMEIDAGRQPTVGANRWGVAVAYNRTGVVAVLRPGETEFDFAVRLPSQEEVSIYAEPTEVGVLITFLFSGRESALIQATRGGAVLAYRSAYQAPPAITTAAGILLYDDESKWLYVLDDQLKTLKKMRLPFYPLESGVSADGRTFAFANQLYLVVGRVKPSGSLELFEIFKYDEVFETERRSKQVTEALAYYEPARPGGSPAIGFSSGGGSTPWTGTVGGAFEIRIRVRSQGGPGRGLRVHIAGKALELARFSSVSAESLQAELRMSESGALDAELVDVDIPEGIMLPFDPPPKNAKHKARAAELLAQTEFEVRIDGHSIAAGSELLEISISALESKARPLKLMQPLKIS